MGGPVWQQDLYDEPLVHLIGSLAQHFVNIVGPAESDPVASILA